MTSDILTRIQSPIQCVRTSFLASASFGSSAGKKNISTSKLVKSQAIMFILASHQVCERVYSLAKVILFHKTLIYEGIGIL